MFKKGNGFTIQQFVATVAAVAIITIGSYAVLNKSNVADNANKFQTELVQTVGTLSDKAIKNETAETTYNLGTIITSKGIYSAVQKKPLKKVGNNKVDTDITGIVTYTGGDTIVLGSNGVDNDGNVGGASSLSGTKVDDKLDPNSIGVLLGTSWNLTDYCDANGVDANDGVLTVQDTKDNANKDIEDICRGVLSGDAKSSVIYVAENEKTAKKMNTDYFDNMGTIVDIQAASGTSAFSGVVVPAK